jgi:GR25 family glycosyltransferase involved in LPS biosynthesis
MDINKIYKYVINLDRREDRMKSISFEMNYIGWDFERFSAVDTNDHRGCSLSHIQIIKNAMKLGLDEVMVIEDDCTMMPYAKSLIESIAKDTENIDYGIFNLAPTLNRPVSKSANYSTLLDLTNYPPKQEHQRGIFATNMIVYHHSIYDELLKLEPQENLGYYAIDDFIYQFIMNKKQCYAPIIPIGPQISNWSDVSHGIYNNFYTQTYNWNLYSPVKIPSEFLNMEQNLKTKQDNLFIDFII